MRFIRVSSMKMAWMVFSVVCTLSVSAFGQPWDGNGVEGDPYQIWTAADMQAIGVKQCSERFSGVVLGAEQLSGRPVVNQCGHQHPWQY